MDPSKESDRATFLGAAGISFLSRKELHKVLPKLNFRATKNQFRSQPKWKQDLVLPHVQETNEGFLYVEGEVAVNFHVPTNSIIL